MSSTVSPSATDRFSMVLDGLCRVVAARIAGGRMQAAMIVLIWNRLRRIERQVLALVAAIRAGTVRTRRAGVTDMPREAMRTGIPRSLAPGLPRGFAWLVKLVPYEAAGFGSQLRHLLGDPEMVALLAAEPRLGTLLRPLCRMLGLEAGLVMPVVVVGVETSVGSNAAAATATADGENGVRPLAAARMGFGSGACGSRWSGVRPAGGWAIFDPV